MQKHKLILLILILAVFSLGAVRLVICNSMSTSGTFLGKINDQIKHYETENAVLGEKVLNLSSFLNISKKADRLGFQPKKTAFSITNTLPIALKQ
jgi:cell division protein FtsL